ncbi:DUF4189 domain-containing protein [Luteibacter aegosomaticola]|uniref:DUF4189 domain-containing protein n=1 Tax=Luteibacter aegosomaticola TaxID=2911538 RepID=UPI003CCE529C
MIRKILVLSALLWGGGASAQCAPGIPSAGNPGCIPPNQTNSPYYQGQADTPPQPVARWADRWGSIAMDESGAAGTIEGQPSESAASKEALARCEENGGRQCKTVLSFHNQCAAVAQLPTGGRIYATGSPTTKKAEEASLARCGQSSCVIVYSECSMPVRID